MREVKQVAALRCCEQVYIEGSGQLCVQTRSFTRCNFFIVNSMKMVAGNNYLGSSMAASGCGAVLLVHMEGLRAQHRVPVHAGTRSFGGVGTVLGRLLNALF